MFSDGNRVPAALLHHVRDLSVCARAAPQVYQQGGTHTHTHPHTRVGKPLGSVSLYLLPPTDRRVPLLLQSYGDTLGKIQRALAIWSGFGMTLTGVHTCGDYMFSGHTVVITMLNFFVTECESLSFALRLILSRKSLNLEPLGKT